MKVINKIENYNLLSVQKNCKDDSEKNLFRGKEAIMIAEARKNQLAFFPGKEIKKTKRNFNIENALIKKTFSALPKELQTYLTTVKDFFEGEKYPPSNDHENKQQYNKPMESTHLSSNHQKLLTQRPAEQQEQGARQHDGNRQCEQPGDQDIFDRILL
jgi:hypothetical protein